MRQYVDRGDQVVGLRDGLEVAVPDGQALRGGSFDLRPARFDALEAGPGGYQAPKRLQQFPVPGLDVEAPQGDTAEFATGKHGLQTSPETPNARATEPGLDVEAA
ncbi:MAG TPA: hypothetical protein PLE61_13345 [Vicinamibacterales bacterium]|nr:hypothetical protein [Vicinamibacterales bacterium]HPW21785.1 hypothetical protein [Vicinamibacterales bacterium]